MITISRTVDLSRMCRVESLVGVAFTNEQGGHRFEIATVRNEVPESITGSISARFIRADRTCVQITPSYCEIRDGKAYVTLPGNCYTVPGIFALVIFNIVGDDPSDTEADRTAIYSCGGYVRPGETDTIIDPENVINVDAIQAMIDDMQDATAAAQEAASFVNTIIAPTYSTSLLYSPGDYCTNIGAMYRCVTETDGQWDPEAWELVTVADELLGIINNIPIATVAETETYLGI